MIDTKKIRKAIQKLTNLKNKFYDVNADNAAGICTITDLLDEIDLLRKQIASSCEHAAQLILDIEELKKENNRLKDLLLDECVKDGQKIGMYDD